MARVHLTRAIGTRLAGTLYVLDEPTVGLHPTDVSRLSEVLEELCALENTVVVVEHDTQVMARAQYLVELGPGAGEHGGEVVYSGSYDDLVESAETLTAKCLRNEVPGVSTEGTVNNRKARDSKKASRKVRTRAASLPWGHVEITGAQANNLKQIDLRIPLRGLVAFTGVSGSGKSSLLEEVVYKNLESREPEKKATPKSASKGSVTADLSMETLGWARNAEIMRVPSKLGEVRLLDQNPIGRSSRSNPATYMKILDPLRKLLAAQPKAKELGLGPGAFSFNSPKGRCPRCGGAGFERVEMQFLADMELRCPDCAGRRYRDEVLAVTLEGLSVAELLELTVEEALQRFAGEDKLVTKLQTLEEVGLGYLRLGQPATTLSGGEAQRLKLARALKTAKTGTLVLLDEPTVGLHASDVGVLVRLLHRLVERGVSVWVVEHNLAVVAAAHHIVDLGPGGGPQGGEVVVQGPLEQVMRHPTSRTGAALVAVSRGQSPGSSVQKHGATRQSTKAKSKQAKSKGRKTRRGGTRRGGTEDPKGQMLIQGAQEHNLRDLTVSLPRNVLVGVTGVSGSGKSTLAFDILFAEGQRRYLESQDAYVRTAVRPLPRPPRREDLGAASFGGDLPAGLRWRDAIHGGHGHRDLPLPAAPVFSFWRAALSRL